MAASGIAPFAYVNVELAAGQGPLQAGVALPSTAPGRPLGVGCARLTQRSENIIDKASDYYAGVTRISVPTSLIPFAVAPMDPDAAGADAGLSTAYRVTLSFEDAPNIRAVITEPLKLVKGLGNPRIANALLQPDGYNFIWTREDLAAMMTDALKRAFARTPSVWGMTFAHPGYVSFDATTQLNTMVLTPLSRFDLGSTADVKIWVNQLAAVPFLGWPQVVPQAVLTHASFTQNNDMFAYLNVRCNGANALGGMNPNGDILPADTGVPLLFAEHCPNTAMLALQTIQVRSGLSGVAESTDRLLGNPSGEVVQIFGDLEVDNSASPGTFSMPLVYAVSGASNVRQCKMTSNSEIKNFTLELWWTDQSGHARQVRSLGQRCSVKLQFSRRSTVDHWPFSFGEQEETRLNASRATAVMYDPARDSSASLVRVPGELLTQRELAALQTRGDSVYDPLTTDDYDGHDAVNRARRRGRGPAGSGARRAR